MKSQKPQIKARWHAFCWARGVSHPVHSQRSVDVFVVDTPRAAGVALGVPRTDAESTHVLCRHSDETPRDFSQRVQRRLARISHTRRVRSLWYVVGADVATADGELPLLGSLLPLLDTEANLTVVGPDSRQTVLFEGIDSVLRRQPHDHDLTVRAQLYADSERTAPRSSVRAARPTPALPPSAGHFGWFRVDAGTGVHAPASVRAYLG